MPTNMYVDRNFNRHSAVMHICLKCHKSKLCSVEVRQIINKQIFSFSKKIILPLTKLGKWENYSVQRNTYDEAFSHI